MVADCGGGTADITVYEMLSATGGKLKELYKATGGPYGSIGGWVGVCVGMLICMLSFLICVLDCFCIVFVCVSKLCLK